MVKRIALTGLIVLMVFTFAAPVYCDDMFKKLGRGAANIVTCPYELVYQIMKSNKSDGAFAGMTVGLLKGLGMIVVRGAAGAYEVVTFPIPVPKDYQPILKDPEFFFEDQNW